MKNELDTLHFNLRVAGINDNKQFYRLVDCIVGVSDLIEGIPYLFKDGIGIRSNRVNGRIIYWYFVDDLCYHLIAGSNKFMTRWSTVWTVDTVRKALKGEPLTGDNT